MGKSTLELVIFRNKKKYVSLVYFENDCALNLAMEN